jgi:hypothetical protein
VFDCGGTIMMEHKMVVLLSRSNFFISLTEMCFNVVSQVDGTGGGTGSATGGVGGTVGVIFTGDAIGAPPK